MQQPITKDAQGRAIFISYRRDDSEGEAGRLFDDLVRAFGENNVFMDVAGIEFGRDFRKAIDENVTCCGVLLAVIGPRWTSVANANGTRRLEDANDFVRLEIAAALGRDVPVIPVLVHDAKMPRPDDLPDDLKALAFRNSIELRHTRWNSDVDLLIAALKEHVTVAPERAAPAAPAPVPLPQPAPPAPTASKLPMLLGIAALVLVALIAGIYLASGRHKPKPRPDNQVDAAAFVGTWQLGRQYKVNRNADDLSQIEVTPSGHELNVKAWGSCPSGLCYWGAQPAKFDAAQALTGAYQPRITPHEQQTGRTVTLVLHPSEKELLVTTRNNYAQSGGDNKEISRSFLRVGSN